ncbi:MAG: hypothetical protein ACT4OF_12845 [Caulobacteraceae bacterium]
MLEDNPALKERVMGLGAIAAAGIGGLLAVDLLVTGGFDFGPGRARYDREQPSAYVRMVDAAQYVGDSFRSIGWNEAFLLRPPDTSASEERLAGADDGTAPETVTEVSDGDLYEQIAALYTESESTVEEPTYDEPRYEDAPALNARDAEPMHEEPAYEEPTYEDEAANTNEKEAASAYEGESPW